MKEIFIFPSNYKRFNLKKISETIKTSITDQLQIKYATIQFMVQMI